MTTLSLAAKGALFDRLATYTATGQPLEGLQVAYALPGSDLELECLYGGAVQFQQQDAVAEAPGIMVVEEALISVHIRVAERPAGDVRDTDTRAAEIGSKLGILLRAEPRLAGGNAVVGISRGAADYSQTPDETVTILSYQLRVSTNLSYGGV